MPFSSSDTHDQNKKIAEIRKEEAENLAKIIAERYELNYADLSGIPIESDALHLIPEQEARKATIAVFQAVGKLLRIAIQSPQRKDTEQIIERLKEKGYEIEIYIVTIPSLEKAWSRYTDTTTIVAYEAGVVRVEEENVTDIREDNESTSETFARLKHEFENPRPISELLTLILETALAENASDIHLEPQEHNIHLRFRIDGILVHLLTFESVIYKRLISRIKILSGLKLNIVHEPQDGRFSIKAGSINAEVRTSLIPGAFGESVVLRLLDPHATNITIQHIGLDSKLLDRVLIELTKPNGLILTTGPTGSGKTTALYSFLKEVYRPGIKIITIENPVEYKINGIVQTQVDKEKGYDFYDGLTSSLRQDPDILLIGEIRDENTAKTAVQAALTGHLVFSTLHTNDAVGAIPRMRDLGVKEDVLGSSLNLILTQRLIRKLKPDYRKERILTSLEKNMIEKIMSGVPDERWRALYETGVVFEPSSEISDHENYSGRIGIFEGIVVDEEVEYLIRNDEPLQKIDQTGRIPYEILSLKQHGILNVLQGVTSLSELQRVVSLFD